MNKLILSLFLYLVITGTVLADHQTANISVTNLPFSGGTVAAGINAPFFNGTSTNPFRVNGTTIIDASRNATFATITTTSNLGGDLAGSTLPNPLVASVTGCGNFCVIGSGSGAGAIKLQIQMTDTNLRMNVLGAANSDADYWANPLRCGGFSINPSGGNSLLQIISPHGCTPSTLTTASVSGTNLTYANSSGGTVQKGQVISGTGGLYIISGAGTSWTLNGSATIGPTTLIASSIAAAHPVCRSPNSNEAGTGVLCTMSNNSAWNMETGLLVSSAVNGFGLESSNNDMPLFFTYAGTAGGTITAPQPDNATDILAYLNTAQTFLAGETFSGTLNVTGTLQAAGVSGVTKSCVTAAATLTISKGIITSTSGAGCT